MTRLATTIPVVGYGHLDRLEAGSRVTIYWWRTGVPRTSATQNIASGCVRVSGEGRFVETDQPAPFNRWFLSNSSQQQHSGVALAFVAELLSDLATSTGAPQKQNTAPVTVPPSPRPLPVPVSPIAPVPLAAPVVEKVPAPVPPVPAAATPPPVPKPKSGVEKAVSQAVSSAAPRTEPTTSVELHRALLDEFNCRADKSPGSDLVFTSPELTADINRRLAQVGLPIVTATRVAALLRLLRVRQISRREVGQGHVRWCCKQSELPTIAKWRQPVDLVPGVPPIKVESPRTPAPRNVLKRVKDRVVFPCQCSAVSPAWSEGQRVYVHYRIPRGWKSCLGRMHRWADGKWEVRTSHVGIGVLVPYGRDRDFVRSSDRSPVLEAFLMGVSRTLAEKVAEEAALAFGRPDADLPTGKVPPPPPNEADAEKAPAFWGPVALPCEGSVSSPDTTKAVPPPPPEPIRVPEQDSVLPFKETALKAVPVPTLTVVHRPNIHVRIWRAIWDQ